MVMPPVQKPPLQGLPVLGPEAVPRKDSLSILILAIVAMHDGWR